MIRPTILLDRVTSKGVRVLAEVAEQALDDLRARYRVARVAALGTSPVPGDGAR